MIRMFFKKLILCSVILCGSQKLLSDFSMYQKSLDTFVFLQQEADLNTYKGMVQLFLTFDQSVSKIVKGLRNEIQIIKKKIKTTNDVELQCLLQEMHNLLSFIKKHKIQYEAIVFHNQISVTYQQLFDMVENNEDVIAEIAQDLQKYGLDKNDKKYLQTFVKDIRKASHRVSQFEDYLHSNDVDLKLQNYIFKIELIKLRNAILFDKRYKQQK